MASSDPGAQTEVSHGLSDDTEAATGGAVSGEGTESTPRTGDVIGRYVVLDAIGSGGMGVVLAAYDPQLDRKVALKLVRPGRAQDTDEIEREARIVAKLRHPNLVVVHDVGKTAAGVFLAMEFLEGTTLRVFQARGLSWREIVAVYAQAGRGLAAAHDAEVVHGDFKPDNVLVTAGGREVKLLDFGIAYAGPVAPHPSRSSVTPRGTVGYLAPELWHGAPASRGSDQFAFCVALFEALTGTRPHGVSTLASKSPSEAATPLPWTKNVPTWLRRVVARGLALDPSKRAASMHELVDELVAGQGRARTRVVAAVASAIVTAGVVAGALRGDPCRDAEAVVRAHWAGDREARVRAEIDEEFGASTFDELEPKIEAFVDDLAAGAHRSCQVRGRDPVLDSRRDRCVEVGLAELEALDSLVAGNRTELLAAGAWVGLGHMVSLHCADDDAMQWRTEGTPDMTASGELRELARRSLRIEMLGVVDRSAAYDEAQALLPEVRAADPSLYTHALFAIAAVMTERGDLAEGIRQLRIALESAETARSPGDIALAWLYLAHNIGQLSGSEEIEELAVDRARVIADRVHLVDVDLSLIRMQARMLDRRGDTLAAAERLTQAAALARRHGRTLLEILSQNTAATYFLRADRPEDALRVAQQSTEHLDNRWLPLRERIGVIGSLAAALSANDRIDEAAAATTRALELAAVPGGAITPLQSALACNWCQGVGVACRRDHIPTACTRCVETTRELTDATQSALSGIYIGLSWLADTEVGGGAEVASATIDMLDRRRGWADARADAAYALMPAEPERALAVANEVCETDGMTECSTRAAYVVARLHPDPGRRAAARLRMRDAWRTLDEGGKAHELSITLDLAQSEMITRDEVEPVVAKHELPCHVAWPELDAWWRASASRAGAEAPDVEGSAN